MDFTGNKGRVVDDPNEAKVVAIAEAHHWRVSGHNPFSDCCKLV